MKDEFSVFQPTATRDQKLWIKCGGGGGNVSNTNVSMSYGPATGLVRHPKCSNVYAKRS